MKIIKLGLLILLSFVLMACSQPVRPKLVLHDTQGNLIQFANYANKWIVINYWASWCEPCHREIPQLNMFYQKHKNQDVVLLGVNFDQLPIDKLSGVIKQMNITFPVLISDPAKSLGLQDISSLPATVILAPNGTEKILFGEQTVKTLEAAVQ